MSNHTDTDTALALFPIELATEPTPHSPRTPPRRGFTHTRGEWCAYPFRLWLVSARVPLSNRARGRLAHFVGA